MSKIKICGLTRTQDITAVNHSLPDYIGFVFADSRRQVDKRTAAMLKEQLDGRIKAVGVFVNEDADFVAELYKCDVIDLAQLHGDEDDSYIARLKERCGCPVIKAVGVGDKLPVLPAEPDYLLFDTLSTRRGGTGKIFNWELLKDYDGLPYFLAGGLNAENISKAIQTLAPFCVDVSSGVEAGGVKDSGKIRQIVCLARC
jgi:phosphoribosylanthranilate isomerase